MLPGTPPSVAEANAPLREGSAGWPVFALQGALGCAGIHIAKDGGFGPKTKKAVEKFQRGEKIAVDGVVGPMTQRHLVSYVCRLIEHEVPDLPSGLAAAMAAGEGGNMLAAVNWSVPGGVDCGLFQLRVYTPYGEDAMRLAFSPLRAGAKAMKDFGARRASFLKRPWVNGNVARAGRCALLAHNWPAGADAYSRYGHVSCTTCLASWVPVGVKFPDGHPVRTQEEWAQFYAMSGPHGSGPIASAVKW
jgi:hypothetical protein